MSSRSVLNHFLLLALLLTACHNGQQMRQALSDLQARNQADSLLTDDSLALALTQYFDRHGTPNERMEAHYLLGRTYADRGEAPQAIAAYQTAAEQADTTATDCDYRLLCRVYSQMGYLFYKQNLMQENLRSLNLSAYYAYIARDSLAALNLLAQQINTFDRLNLPDSVIAVYTKAHKGLCDLGYEQTAATFSAVTIKSFLALAQFEQARECINEYETKTGFFSNGEIEHGREFFYYLKGLYYLSTHQYDSAEYYFRKELFLGNSFNDQNAASKGLANLYKQTNHPDSSAKYALYSYAMNDSMHAQMATNEVIKVQALYNYTRFQKQVLEERMHANEEKHRADFVLTLFVVFIFIVISVTYIKQTRRKAEREMYQQKLRELERAQSDILQLRDHEAENKELIIEKEETIRKQQAEIDKLRLKIKGTLNDAESRLINSSVYKQLHKKADKGLELTIEEWHAIHQLMIEILPQFYQFIS